MRFGGQWMDDEDRQTDAPLKSAADTGETDTVAAAEADKEEIAGSPPPSFDESIVEELGALIDDGRTYAQAEIAFQKTRAALAGKSVGLASLYVVLALILLNIAFLALAVGLVIALQPIVTIWGAIAIVVGALFLIVTLLGLSALKQGKKLATLFASSDEEDGA